MNSNTKLIFVMLAALLAVSLAFTACGSGSTPEPSTITYTDGDTEITITKDPNRAAYTPVTGDTYVLKVSGVIKGQGTVKVVSAAITFTSSANSSYTFTANISQGFLVFADTAKIIYDDGTQVSSPGAMTPTDSGTSSAIEGVWVNPNELNAGTSYPIAANKGRLIIGSGRFAMNERDDNDGGKWKTRATGTYNSKSFTLEYIYNNGGLTNDASTLNYMKEEMGLTSLTFNYTISGSTMTAIAGPRTWVFNKL
jgi:hypothetical protein